MVDMVEAIIAKVEVNDGVSHRTDASVSRPPVAPVVVAVVMPINMAAVLRQDTNGVP